MDYHKIESVKRVRVLVDRISTIALNTQKEIGNLSVVPELYDGLFIRLLQESEPETRAFIEFKVKHWGYNIETGITIDLTVGNDVFILMANEKKSVDLLRRQFNTVLWFGDWEFGCIIDFSRNIKEDGFVFKGRNFKI